MTGRLSFGAQLVTQRHVSVEEVVDLAVRAEEAGFDRSAGRPRPVDGPYLAVRDAGGFEADCRVAARLGFQGKLCIHPTQVPVANRVFSPDPDEAAFCERVVEAFREAEARGSASITVDGVFVDDPIAEKAERVARLARTLTARDAATVGGRQA